MTVNGATSQLATATNEWILNLTLYVFIVEAAAKIASYGPHPQHYLLAPEDGPYNRFDFLLVVLSLALVNNGSAGALKTLRLLRLVRLLTIIKNVPELKVRIS